MALMILMRYALKARDGLTRHVALVLPMGCFHQWQCSRQQGAGRSSSSVMACNWHGGPSRMSSRMCQDPALCKPYRHCSQFSSALCVYPWLSTCLVWRMHTGCLKEGSFGGFFPIVSLCLTVVCGHVVPSSNTP